MAGWTRVPLADGVHLRSPASMDGNITVRPQVSPILAPVAVDPVNEMTGTLGCSTSACPAVFPRPCTS